MARVLLISYAGRPCTPSSLMPDNGLASLAGALTARGHEVRIADWGTVSTAARLFPPELRKRASRLAERLFLEDGKLSWWQKLRFLWTGWRQDRHQARETDRLAREAAAGAEDFDPDVVGLKLWNGDGFAGEVKIAEAIKERLPEVPLIAGGPHVDYFGQHILQYTDAFDALVAGEGERVLPHLAEGVENGRPWRELPGVIRRKGGRIRRNPNPAVECLDELPLPVYDPEVYPALEGDEKIKIGVLDESRGCPNRCAFCIHPIKSGGKWVLKSAARVVSELKHVMESLGSRYFIYSGSNTPAKAATGIAREIIAQDLDVHYGCFGHVGCMAPADFDLLRGSGCEAIFYGLESASPRILRKSFDKPANIDKAEQVIRQSRAAGIMAITSVIHPAPFEDEVSRQATLDFLRRVRPDSVPLTIPGMIPGTPWERNPAKYGFRKSGGKKMWEKALTYKIKLLYPPSLWEPLPYTLNGKSSRELFKECEQFGRAVEKLGIPTNIPHEMALMAHALGQSGDLKGFRDRCRAAFLSGNVERISSMTERINANVKYPADQTGTRQHESGSKDERAA